MRNHLERIELVEPVQAGQVDGGKLQAQEAPAYSQDTIGLLQRALDARNVADAERDRDAIETAVGIGKLFGIALFEDYGALKSARDGPRATHVQHVGVDIAHG